MSKDEYVVGFYGDFNNYLEGFGVFVANETHEFKEEDYYIEIEEIIIEPEEEPEEVKVEEIEEKE